MPIEHVVRATHTLIDSRAALALSREGKTLRQITEALAPGASLMAALRAIRRGKRQESAASQIRYEGDE